MHIHRVALVPHGAATMFDIVDTPEAYPDFLPWCRRAVLLERNSIVTMAELVIGFRGLEIRFTTRNPKSRPEFMQIQLVSGPFSQFSGEWRFRPIDESACEIEFTMSYEFRSGLIGNVAGSVFSRIADTLVDAFVARARTLQHGGVPGRA